ncbi:MAG: SUMF1/EgtB/PvdO family nonheme iron enzyme [Planctomycetales bacterium]|nr:SUMF1/EgtB/PvdO family nonheme iron enzyme [Planctomycetales bacterium]
MRLLQICMFLLSTCFALSPAVGQDAVNEPGLSATKPASGPFVEVDRGFMVPYSVEVPGGRAAIEMVPVPGGTFLLGSPDAEENRSEDEGPQLSVKLPPFWIAKYETSWIEYKYYMSMYQVFKNMASAGKRAVDDSNRVDAVTAPTALYEPSFTFEFGDDDKLPAITMTQFAAKQYTKWLSKLTGQQYRLPTEAEWEYACRAGTTTAYSFGDDPSELADYAWFFENSESGPQEIGQKKPNPWGLHDMHGNVMEWVIDGYQEDGYANRADLTQPIGTLDSVLWPEAEENRIVRGGSWQDDADRLRSAARFPSSDDDWKDQDPNIPLSPWWYTSDPARGVGFRIVRGYESFDNDTMKKFWDIDNEDIQMAVEIRLEEGRGVERAVDQAMAKEIE